MEKNSKEKSGKEKNSIKNAYNSKVNKKMILDSDYSHLQSKIFFKTAMTMLIAAIIAFGIYILVLKGHFANVVIKGLNYFVFNDYQTALDFYKKVIGNNMYLFVLIAMLIIFLIILRVYIRSFTKYFNEINSGIDALLLENSSDVVLSDELSATEKKINNIKHILTRRKMLADIEKQRKNDLVMYLAHDLKTPLTSVIGYLTLLRDEGQISDELREKYLSISLDKAERLEELINEFFEITRFNLSDITLDIREVNLTRLLEQVTYEFKPMLMEKNLQCELSMDKDIMLKCDANKLERVFDNLLRNAVNYSYENGLIRIVVIKGESDTSVKVINKGNTISKEKLERIFEQFYRLDTARSSKNGGAGLGLAIAKEIVELHGGRIRAVSENEVIEFEVVLPIL